MGRLRLRRNTPSSGPETSRPDSSPDDNGKSDATGGVCQHCGATLLRQSNYCAVCGTSIIAATGTFASKIPHRTSGLEADTHSIKGTDKTNPSARRSPRLMVVVPLVLLLLLAGLAIWWFLFRTASVAEAPRPTITSHEAERVVDEYLAALQQVNSQTFRTLLDVDGEEATQAENLLAGSPAFAPTEIAVHARSTAPARDHVVEVTYTPARTTEPVRTALTVESVAPPSHRSVEFLDELAQPRTRIARSSWQTVRLETNGPVTPIRLNGVAFDWTEAISVPPLVPLLATSEPSPYVEAIERHLSPGSQTVTLEQKLRDDSVPGLVRQLNEALLRRCNSGTQSTAGSCPLGFGPRSNYVYRNTTWATDPAWMQSATTSLTKTGITVSFTKLQATASYDYAPSHEPTNATAGKTSITTQGRMELKLGDDPTQFTWAS